MEPINYLAQVADPFAQATQGLQLGAGMAELQQKQAAMVQQQQRQQLAAQEQARFFSNPNPTMRDAARYASLLSPEQANAFRPFMEGITKEQQQGALKSTGQLLSALQANPQTGIRLLQERAVAAQNSGDKDDANLFNRLAEAAIADPVQGTQTAFKALVQSSAGIPGAKEFFETIDKGLTTARAEAEAPAELRQKLAAANTAEAEAKVKMETATDDIAKAKATREFEQAKAKKEQIQADTELQTRLADLGFKKAQTNKFNVETRNLDTQGKMLSLDFQAALQGLPLPSKKTEGGGGSPTEDERKAAGWLAQATNAYNNMLGAMYTKEGKITGAEKPGVIESALGTLPFIGEGSAALARGTDRQKFTQAASSLSEALLRAATGAGVNRDEAKQKLEELTPLFTDDADTRKQKLAAIPVYLDSLKSRAGRAAPSGYQVPQAATNALSITLPDGTLFTAPNQKALDEFKRRAGL
jgi:hypothetical protein